LSAKNVPPKSERLYLGELNYGPNCSARGQAALWTGERKANLLPPSFRVAKYRDQSLSAKGSKWIRLSSWRRERQWKPAVLFSFARPFALPFGWLRVKEKEREREEERALCPINQSNTGRSTATGWTGHFKVAAAAAPKVRRDGTLSSAAGERAEGN